MKFTFVFFLVFFFGSLVCAQNFSIEQLTKFNQMSEDDFQKEMTKYEFTGFDKVESIKSRILIYSNENESFAIAKEVVLTKNIGSKITFNFENKVFYDKYLDAISILKYQPSLQEQVADGAVKYFKKGNIF